MYGKCEDRKYEPQQDTNISPKAAVLNLLTYVDSTESLLEAADP
jgi:hypothetical protein